MSQKIAPSILAADFARLGAEVEAVRTGCDQLHVDVMDGHFVPNMTFGLGVVKRMQEITSLPLDVHLMIEEPEKYAEAFKAAGADVLTIHAEACKHLHRNLQQIKDLGMKAGIALNPHTPISAIDEVIVFGQ